MLRLLLCRRRLRRRRRSTPTSLLPPQPLLQRRPSTSPTSTSRRLTASSCRRPWRCENKKKNEGQVFDFSPFLLLARSLPLFADAFWLSPFSLFSLFSLCSLFFFIFFLRPSTSPQTASRSSTTGSWRSPVRWFSFLFRFASRRSEKLASPPDLSLVPPFPLFFSQTRKKNENENQTSASSPSAKTSSPTPPESRGWPRPRRSRSSSSTTTS